MPKLEVDVYVAAAENDGSYLPDMAKQFETARAVVRYRAATYRAANGWMKPDLPVYDCNEAERGWVKMLALFARNLRGGGRVWGWMIGCRVRLV